MARSSSNSQRKQTQRRETVAAQVFLRSVSGRTLNEIAEGPLPKDLSPFRAPEAARKAVHRFLADVGFKVLSDEAGLTLTIEASPERFAKTFDVDPADIVGVKAHQTIKLRPPVKIQALVDQIVISPKPELF